MAELQSTLIRDRLTEELARRLNDHKEFKLETPDGRQFVFSGFHSESRPFRPASGSLSGPVAVVEFLPAVGKGLSQAEFMARIEAEIEGASNRLMAEAGFVAPQGG